MLRGPTAAEREAGLSANFTEEETGEMLIEARIEGRRAVVNLKSEITSVSVMNNVSTTSGGGGFIHPLLATAFGFPEVEEVLPQFDGDTDAFWEFLESSGGAVTRAKWGNQPTSPVPAGWEGSLGAAMYVGPALERFAAASWFPQIKSVTGGGSEVGVTVGLDSSPASRATAGEIGRAVAQLLVDSRKFCEVRFIKVRNGADDRSNLAFVSRSTGDDCWKDGYQVRVLP